MTSPSVGPSRRRWAALVLNAFLAGAGSAHADPNCPTDGLAGVRDNAAGVLNASCQARLASAECTTFAARLAESDRRLLETCQGSTARGILKSCGEGAGQFFVSAAEGAIDFFSNPTVYLRRAADSVGQCDRSPEARRAILEPLEGILPEWTRARAESRLDCASLSREVMQRTDRLVEDIRRRARAQEELLEQFDRTPPDRRARLLDGHRLADVSVSDQERQFLEDLEGRHQARLSGLWTEIRQQYACLSTEAHAEILCRVVAGVGTGLATGAATAVALRAALARVPGMTEKIARWAASWQKGRLSRSPERLQARLRQLFPEQNVTAQMTQAVVDVHERRIRDGVLGTDGRPAGIGNLDEAELRRTMRQLESGGWSRAQASQIIRTGLAGDTELDSAGIRAVNRRIRAFESALGRRRIETPEDAAALRRRLEEAGVTEDELLTMYRVLHPSRPGGTSEEARERLALWRRAREGVGSLSSQQLALVYNVSRDRLGQVLDQRAWEALLRTGSRAQGADEAAAGALAQTAPPAAEAAPATGAPAGGRAAPPAAPSGPLARQSEISAAETRVIEAERRLNFHVGDSRIRPESRAELERLRTQLTQLRTRADEMAGTERVPLSELRALETEISGLERRLGQLAIPEPEQAVAPAARPAPEPRFAPRPDRDGGRGGSTAAADGQAQPDRAAPPRAEPRRGPPDARTPEERQLTDLQAETTSARQALERRLAGGGSRGGASRDELERLGRELKALEELIEERVEATGPVLLRDVASFRDEYARIRRRIDAADVFGAPEAPTGRAPAPASAGRATTPGSREPLAGAPRAEPPRGVGSTRTSGRSQPPPHPETTRLLDVDRDVSRLDARVDRLLRDSRLSDSERARLTTARADLRSIEDLISETMERGRPPTPREVAELRRSYQEIERRIAEPARPDGPAAPARGSETARRDVAPAAPEPPPAPAAPAAPAAPVAPPPVAASIDAATAARIDRVFNRFSEHERRIDAILADLPPSSIQHDRLSALRRQASGFQEEALAQLDRADGAAAAAQRLESQAGRLEAEIARAEEGARRRSAGASQRQALEERRARTTNVSELSADRDLVVPGRAYDYSPAVPQPFKQMSFNTRVVSFLQGQSEDTARRYLAAAQRGITFDERADGIKALVDSRNAYEIKVTTGGMRILGCRNARGVVEWSKVVQTGRDREISAFKAACPD